MSKNETLPNLYIVGFMGTGKTTVGRTVAGRLGLQFIDVDRAVESKVGMPVKDIFETLGETVFREEERNFILRGHAKEGCVVSCGGGLPMQPGVIEILKQQGVLICLFASVSVILSRVTRTSKRPLIAGENPEFKIRQLLEERMPTYMQCGTGVLTDGRSIQQIADHVMRIYLAKAKEFEEGEKSKRQEKNKE